MAHQVLLDTRLHVCYRYYSVLYTGRRNLKDFKKKFTKCMEALADKVHKQGEHIPQHIATFHTTIPT